MTRQPAHAVVVGGGLAGTRAAVGLADQGWSVTLLEARARLGGAAYSFQRRGLTIDTGQHLALRCYSEYRALLARMGAAGLVPVQNRMEIPVLAPGRPAVWLRRSRILPAPLHLLPAIARYHALTVAERAAAVRGFAALRRVRPDDPRRDAETFGSWLRRHGQGERVIGRLWALVGVAALNIDVDQASLALAAQVFRTGLLEHAHAGDLARPAAGLSTMHDVAARRLLARIGVRARTGQRVSSVRPVDGSFVVCTADAEIEADAVVVAVPHRQASRVVPAAACPDRDRWSLLGSSPIVNVHVRYDRPVTRLPFAAALDSPAPWVFDRTTASGCERGQYLVISISAAVREITESADELCRRHQDALCALFPAARSAQVVDSFVTREPHATFCQRAGTAELRPRTSTRLPNLMLAGAWTATGWPDTMEGAVRSGATAARQLGSPDRITSTSEMSAR